MYELSLTAAWGWLHHRGIDLFQLGQDGFGSFRYFINFNVDNIGQLGSDDGFNFGF